MTSATDRATDGSQRGLAEVGERVLPQLSRYVDDFLSRRSTLTSSAFPNKLEMMAWGYLYMHAAIPELTARCAATSTPAKLGRRLRRLGARGTGVQLASCLWSYCFGGLVKGWVGPTASGEEVHEPWILGYWWMALESYRGGKLTLAPGEALSPYRVLPTRDIELADASCAALDANAVAGIRRLLARATSYSWLLECESRQGVFRHGPYALNEQQHLTVRSFAGLSGQDYSWAAKLQQYGLPDGQLTVVLRHTPVRGDVAVDLFGVPAEDSGPLDIDGVGVWLDDRPSSDPLRTLTAVDTSLKSANLAALEIIMGWNDEQRCEAGSHSYAKILTWLASAAIPEDQSTEDESTRGTAAATDSLLRILEDHNGRMREQVPLGPSVSTRLWEWVADTDRPTVFAPLAARK